MDRVAALLRLAVYLVETLHVEAVDGTGKAVLDGAGKPVMTIRPKDESVAHVKAVCLLRPTAENIKALKQHLQEPRFLEYHLFFTNMVPQVWCGALETGRDKVAPVAGASYRL